VLHTPGHTPGHASYYHPGYRVLIAGDAVGPALGGRLRAPQPVYCEDNGQARKSIAKLAALDVDLICCGHGPIIRDGGHAFRQLIAVADPD
jgi:glyoxylase-like metal-dependent hydrolase (beta-lactamase superfamily II)